MRPAALFNGRPAPSGLAWHRGLHYGDGVFRTCLIFKGKVIDLQGQIGKLTRDASRLDIVPEEAGKLGAEARRLAARQPRAVLKMVLMRATTERGYRSTSRGADRLLLRSQAPSYPPEHWSGGIRLFRTGVRLAPQPLLAGIKHLNRLEQVLAARRWVAEAGEGLVEDEAGRPLCGTRSNLFWVKGGVLRTAALERCGVAGRMRERVLAAAAEAGMRTRVAAGPWEEFLESDEVFVTNSLIGIWPVRELEGRTWPAPGAAARRLDAALRHPRLAGR